MCDSICVHKHVCNSVTWNILRWLDPLSCDAFILRVHRGLEYSLIHLLVPRTLFLMNVFWPCLIASWPLSLSLCFLSLPGLILMLSVLTIILAENPSLDEHLSFTILISRPVFWFTGREGETCLRNSGPLAWDAVTCFAAARFCGYRLAARNVSLSPKSRQPWRVCSPRCAHWHQLPVHSWVLCSCIWFSLLSWQDFLVSRTNPALWLVPGFLFLNPRLGGGWNLVSGP